VKYLPLANVKCSLRERVESNLAQRQQLSHIRAANISFAPRANFTVKSIIYNKLSQADERWSPLRSLGIWDNITPIRHVGATIGRLPARKISMREREMLLRLRQQLSHIRAANISRATAHFTRHGRISLARKANFTKKATAHARLLFYISLLPSSACMSVYSSA
jgi:hypothetical protein